MPRRTSSAAPEPDDVRDFDTFVLTYGPQLVAFASRLTFDHHRAEDAVQEALARCSRSWQRIGSLPNPKAYVYRAVVNEVRSWHRRRQSRERPVDLGPDVREGGRGFEVTLADRDLLRLALLKLSTAQRAVLVMRHYLGYSDDDIGTTLAIPVSTVRSHARRGLQRLRHDLERGRDSGEDI